MEAIIFVIKAFIKSILKLSNVLSSVYLNERNHVEKSDNPFQKNLQKPTVKKTLYQGISIIT